MKDFRFNEKHALQFRMEMFNAPNHPAWGRPIGGVGHAERDARRRLRPHPPTSQLRQIQFALKYHF